MLESFLKRSIWTDMLISFVFVIFGILLYTYPTVMDSMIAIVLGAIFVVMGVLKIIDYFATGKSDNYLLAIGITAIIAGIIIMLCSNVIVSIFRIIIGIWIIYKAILNLQTIIKWKDYKSAPWYITLIMSILTIILGVYILLNQGTVLEIIGVLIIFYGIFDIVENVIFMKNIKNYEE